MTSIEWPKAFPVAPTPFRNALAKASAVVAVFSVHGNSSPHVVGEIEFCVQTGVPLLIYKGDATAPSGPLAVFESACQWFDGGPVMDTGQKALFLSRVLALLPDGQKARVKPDHSCPPPSEIAKRRQSADQGRR